MVSDIQSKILIFEDLKTKNMIKKPKVKPKDKGGWNKNCAKAKA